MPAELHRVFANGNIVAVPNKGNAQPFKLIEHALKKILPVGEAIGCVATIQTSRKIFATEGDLAPTVGWWYGTDCPCVRKETECSLRMGQSGPFVENGYLNFWHPPQ